MVSRVSIQNVLSTVYQKTLHTPWGRTTSVALLALGAVALIFRSQIKNYLFTPNYDDLQALCGSLRDKTRAHRSIQVPSDPFHIGNSPGRFQAIALNKNDTNLNVSAIADQAIHDPVPAMVVNTIPATLAAPENYLPGTTLGPLQASRIILPPAILDQQCVKYSIRGFERPIYHFHARWELGALTEGVIGVIQEAAQVINAGKTVLFHYQPGSDSSVCFLALVTFASKKEKLRTATDMDLKREMVAILNDVAKQGRCLYPSITLLKLLLTPVFLRSVFAPLPFVLTSASAKNLANWLAGAAAIGRMEESFVPFTLGTPPGRYIVKGLGSVQMLDDGDTRALETHVKSIMNSEANLVINLMQPQERKNYLTLGLVKLESSDYSSIKLYEFENRKKLYNFYAWPDGEWVNEGAEAALLSLVKSVAKQVNEGKTIFVHCQKGYQRTAVFLALVELARRKEMITDHSEANLRSELFKILLEITKFEKSRFPTTIQLERLMRYDLLEKLVS